MTRNFQVIHAPDLAGDTVNLGPNLKAAGGPDGFLKNEADFGLGGAAMVGGAHTQGPVGFLGEFADGQAWHDLTYVVSNAMMACL
jgi:hypothetical protein